MEIIDVMGKALAPKINIGRRGTYQTETIVFDVSKLIEKYGVGTAVLMVKRPKDTAAYPATTTYEDGKVIWVVTETDTAVTGYGECELFWYVDNGLAKTVIFSMNILRDIGETTEEPPDPYETWVDTLTDLGAETLANAQAAAESAEAAETAAQLLANPTATATTLAPGSEATASYNDGVFAFGIPRGANGTDGSDGTDGVDGVSPTVTVTEITGGHRVTITDADHPQGQSFDVMDGTGGGGGTGDYTDLTNKPSINNVTLLGNKTLSELGINIPTKVSQLTNDSGFLTSETDPTVPSWAKASSKPSYTASEVGAIASPSSPATGAFLVWNGSAWVAQTLATWQGGNY